MWIRTNLSTFLLITNIHVICEISRKPTPFFEVKYFQKYT